MSDAVEKAFETYKRARALIEASADLTAKLQAAEQRVKELEAILHSTREQLRLSRQEAIGDLTFYKSAEQTFQQHIDHWLKINNQSGARLNHGVFPLGMVGGWIERATKAESELARLRAENAAMKASYAKGYPGEWGLANDLGERLAGAEKEINLLYEQRGTLTRELEEAREQLARRRTMVEAICGALEFKMYNQMPLAAMELDAVADLCKITAARLVRELAETKAATQAAKEKLADAQRELAEAKKVIQRQDELLYGDDSVPPDSNKSLRAKLDDARKKLAELRARPALVPLPEGAEVVIPCTAREADPTATQLCGDNKRPMRFLTPAEVAKLGTCNCATTGEATIEIVPAGERIQEGDA